MPRSSPPRAQHIPPTWVRVAGRVGALLAILAALMLTPAMSAQGAWQRARLRRQIRRRWADGPRLLLCLGSESANPALGAQWRRLASPRAMVVDTTGGAGGVSVRLASAWSPSDLALAEEVRREWGPDFKLMRPPLALLVYRDGTVERLPLLETVTAWRTGAPEALEAALATIRERTGLAASAMAP